MKLAIDVYYYDNKAKAVGILFKNWEQEVPDQIITSFITDVAEYQPGSFYKRELPCILDLLKQVDLSEIEAIIIDGFVYLDNQEKPGLGKYLYDSLNGKLPVIGVAKTPFFQNEKLVKEVLRGESIKPLYITSVGISLDESAENVKNMHGKYRFPTLLKLLDQETKNKL